MKTLAVLGLFAGFLSVPANAQKLTMNFDVIAQKATKKTEVQLDHPPQFTAVDEVSVHNYEFGKPGEYADSDLDPLRKQVSGSPGWSRVVNIKEDGEHTEIYMLTVAGKPAGLLLIAGEAKQLTVVHVLGNIELAQLQELVNSTVHFKEPAQD